MRLLIYCRVSSEEQAERGHSLAAQERLCREALERRDDEIAGVISDPAEHGDNMDRPGILRLREELAAGSADGVCVLDLDRFSRDYAHHIIIANELVKQGHHVYSVADNADYADEEQRVFLDIKAAIAADELRKIRRRSRRGLAERAQQGLTLGPPPFGYRKQVDEYSNAIPGAPIQPVFDEATVVRELFDRYLDGESLQELAEDLFARGVRSHRGGVRWTAARVGEILRSPVYRGRVVHGEEVYAGQHDAIITEETWRATQRRLKERAILHPRRRGSLSPLMRCGICGGPVRISTSPDENREYFQCAMRFNRPAEDRHEPFSARAQAVEAVLWAWLSHLITEDVLAEAARKHYQREVAARRQGRRAEVADRLLEVEDGIALNLRAARSGALPEDMLHDENAPLVSEREKLGRELAQIDAAAGLPERDLSWLKEAGRATIERLQETEDAGRRREFLGRIFEHVDLWSDRMVIYHRLDLLPPREVALPRYWRSEWGAEHVEFGAT
jgi:site-specific DNA recombinase